MKKNYISPMLTFATLETGDIITFSWHNTTLSIDQSTVAPFGGDIYTDDIGAVPEEQWK